MDHTYFANSTNLLRINNKSNNICSVPQCGNGPCRNPKISLHRFPKDINVLMNWLRLFKLSKMPNNAYACSDHFCSDDYILSKNRRRLGPEAVPSRKLPIYSAKALRKQAQKENRQKWNLKRQLFYQKILARPEEKSVIIPEIVVPNEKPAFPNKQVEPAIAKKDVSVQVETIMPRFLAENRPKIMKLIQSDAHMQTCTNLTIKQFLTIYEMVDCFLKRIPVISSEELGLSYSILLTLMKLKENHSFSHLSFLFDVNAASCSSSFYKMIGILRQVLYQFITWPNKEEIRRHLPKQFSSWPRTRVLVDCVDIEVFSSRCSKCDNSYCSRLKIKPTVKFLVGLAPSGRVIFLTDVYDGETPAKTILEECGLLNLCEPGDIIITNSSFIMDKSCQATEKQQVSQSVLEQPQRYNDRTEEIKSVLPKTRPVAINTKPLSENTRLASGNTELVSRNARPVATNIRPAQGNTRPAQENTRPAQGNTRPAQGNARPAQGNTRLAQGNTTPLPGNIKLLPRDNRLVATSIKPLQENTRPAQGNSRLAPGNTKLVSRNTRPVATNIKPLQENARPARENTKPSPESTRPVGANTISVPRNTVRPTPASISPLKVNTKTVERIKSYEIINSPITNEMFDGIDLIINVICALVNFTSPS